jgi:hypothetical protein
MDKIHPRFSLMFPTEHLCPFISFQLSPASHSKDHFNNSIPTKKEITKKYVEITNSLKLMNVPLFHLLSS